VPARRDGRLHEPVGSHGRRPERPCAVEWIAVGQPSRDQPRGRRQLEDQPEPRLVDAGHLRQPLDVAHTQATAAELGNRCSAQGFEYQFHFAQDVYHRTRRDRVDVLRGRRRHHGVRWRQLDGARALAPQRLTYQPRQDHGLRVHLSQQACRQQPLDRTIRRCAGGRVTRPAHRRSLHQPPQQVSLSVVDVGEAVGDLGAAVLGALQYGLARVPGQAGRGLCGHPDLGIAPHKRPLAEVVDRCADRLLADPVGEQRGQLGQRDRRRLRMQCQQRVEHRQPQEIQPVGGGLDGLPGLRAGRQRRDTSRRRLGQVGPQFKQPDQPLVRQIG
jgi:hypothetical protein